MELNPEVSVLEKKWRVPILLDTSKQSRFQPNGLICACIVAVCVLLTYPVAEMGFQDDWSYIRTALEFARTGQFVYNGSAPAQQGPPLNFFVYPYAEVDGRPHEAIDRKFTFTDRERSSTNEGGHP